MLQRIALLAIAAPRRIIAVAVLVMVACGIFGIPVPSTCPQAASGPDVGVSAGDQDPGRQVRPAMLLITVTSTTARRIGGPRHEPISPAVAVVAVCGPGVRGPRHPRRRADQQGRQDRTDRRRHHRRRERAQKHAKTLTDELVHDRDGVTMRRWRGDDVRADQRAERKRPVDDGIDRHPAELPGATWCSAG